MRVGLIGFGKTGKAVATTLLLDKTIHLEWVVRKSDLLEHRSVPEFLGVDSDEPGLIYRSKEFTAEQLLARSPVDAIIDFSSASGVDYYAEAAANASVAVVSAISQYPKEQVRKLQSIADRTRVMWSPNITIGINFLILAAQSLQRIAPHVDIEIIEEHFKDKPEVSGTALRIARALNMQEDDVKTIRAGGIIGVHEILFGFPYQTVRLRHESIGREAFGNGAGYAAKKLIDLPNGFYTMEDLLLPTYTEFENSTLPTISKRKMRGKIAHAMRTIANKIDI
ncbi:MAG: dihydrodipicolinate reductase C-terminal domain-containing protein [Candidatus Nanopelagicales bacterium]